MNTGSVLARFTITLSKAVTEPVQVEWYTSDGTAKAGVDYAANKGIALFAPGETAKTVDILVYGRAVGSEDRSFYVEMLPPTNAILGASLGECIIHVDTIGSTPVTQVIVPTGPEGDSAYQVWLDQGNSGTEQDFFDSLKPNPADIAVEVAPLIDVGATTLTAEGTETLPTPDATTVKAVARRVAYVGAAKIATMTLADGDNLIGQSDLTGDAVSMNSVGLYPRIMRGSVAISPQWSVQVDGRILIKGAQAGDVLYVCQYNFLSNEPVTRLPREALRRTYADAGYNLVDGCFELGGTLSSTNDVLLHEASGIAYAWGGALPKGVPEGSTPSSSGGVSISAWSEKKSEVLRGTFTGGDGKGLNGFYGGGGWTGAEAGSGNFYDNPNHTSKNALRQRWEVPAGEATDPVFWWQKETTADVADGWEQGTFYSALIKQGGTGFGCASTDYAEYNGGSGDLIARNCRTHLNSPGAAGFALWAYTKVSNPSVSRAAGAEISINNGAIEPSWIAEASGDPAGIGAMTALNLGVADGLYGIHHAVRIPNKGANDFKRPWTGILMGQNSIKPADANGNGEAIRLRGASFTSGRYGALALGDDTGAQMFSYGIRSIHADFSSNALIWAKMDQKIVWGSDKAGSSYATWDTASDTFRIGRNGLSIGNSKVLGARVTGIFSLSGTADGATKNTETMTLPELARYVKKGFDAIIAHGIFGPT